MSRVPTRRCAALLLLLFIKLNNDGVYSMEVQSAAEVGPDPEETPLDELEDILDELEMEESSLDLYYHQKKYKELDSQGQCTDKNSQCHAWSCRDECHKNPAYMRPKCTWSCGACGPLRSCVDKNNNCDAWMKKGECTKNPRYMLPNCCWSCMACPAGTCKDRHPHCAYWACIGECEKNPRYMLINCRGSCNVCRQNGNNNPVKAGENCPEPQAKVPKPTCHQKVDVMVLMDGSASVQRRNFPDVKNFVLTLAAGFDFGANGARVGVYQYAIGVQKEIGLNQFDNREDLLDGIKGITFMEGMGTLTGAALTKVQQDFTTANGARSGVKKVVILITDGQSSDDVRTPAQNLKSQGVTISAVGVANYNMGQLQDIADGPEYVATVKEFDKMDSIRDKVLKAVCQAQQKRGQDIEDEITNGLQYMKNMLGALEDKLEQGI